MDFLKERLSRHKFYKPAIVLLLVSYLLSFLIIVISTQRGTLFARPPAPELGKVATEDITVDRDIFYVDAKATTLKREARIKLVSPVFLLNKAIAKESMASFIRFQDIFIRNLKEKNSVVKNTVDTLLTRIQYEFPMIIGKMRREEFALLSSVKNTEEIFTYALVLLEKAMFAGIANFQDIKEQNPELFTSGKVEIWRDEGLEKEEIPLERVITRSRLDVWAEDEAASFPLNEVGKSLVVVILNIFVEENCFYDSLETGDKRRRAREDVDDVTRKLVEGQVIVRKGDVIDEESLIKIKAIGESRINLNINSIAGTALFLITLYFLSFFLLGKRFLERVFIVSQFYLFIGTALMYLLITAFLIQVRWNSQWIPFSVLIPTSMFAILLSLIITVRVGIAFNIILSLLGLLLIRMDVSSFLFAFLSGMAGCAVVLGVEKRIDLIRAGFFLSLLNCLVILMLGFLKNIQVVSLIQALGWGIANGFACSILSLGLLPVLEHIMNAATRFRLMELLDLNSPIFKKMLSLAPGTYNHSTIVANLAESACTEIGANTLLARVGAYYHDIGKVDQAKYFIENQRELNLHDELKPSLSVAVIKSHVKVGIEKAKELGLPKEVVDIIAQHHGKGLISYFYQRALDNEKSKSVSSEDFSYTGEWPQTKEAAVVMLADAAEAASRTLKKPSVAKLEKLIWSIIIDKFNAGELNRSNLTFNDLEKIKNSFVHILAGYYHSRIEYPSQKEEA